MKAKIQLKNIDEKDLPFLNRVYASIREYELRQAPWSDEEKSKFLTMQFNAQHSHYQKHYPNSDFNIILFDNEQIGRLYVDRGEKDMLLIDIALLPEYQKKGIGLFLMKDLINEAKEKNQPIFLHVEKFNPALNFYHKLGFEIIEDKEVYLYMKWTPTVNE